MTNIQVQVIFLPVVELAIWVHHHLLLNFRLFIIVKNNVAMILLLQAEGFSRLDLQLEVLDQGREQTLPTTQCTPHPPQDPDDHILCVYYSDSTRVAVWEEGST